MSVDIALAQRLRAARMATGLKAKDVAATIGVSPQSISVWERKGVGQSPSLNNFLLLANLYAVDVQWLRSGKVPDGAIDTPITHAARFPHTTDIQDILHGRNTVVLQLENGLFVRLQEKREDILAWHQRLTAGVMGAHWGKSVAIDRDFKGAALLALWLMVHRHNDIPWEIDAARPKVPNYLFGFSELDAQRIGHAFALLNAEGFACLEQSELLMHIVPDSDFERVTGFMPISLAA